MILKIQRLVEDEEWWILDRIRHIYVSPVRKFERAKVDELEGDFRFLDDFFNKGSPGTTKEDVAFYKHILCTLPDNQQISVIFDTVAYLCNDNGKTIEKLMV